jgi:uracil phosphoribosyltransferase
MAVVLAQIEGAAEALKSANAAGWTAVLVVVVLVASLSFIGWLVKCMKEERTALSSRLGQVEDFQRNELVSMVKESAEITSRAVVVMDRLVTAFTGCPCVEPVKLDKQKPGT